MQSPKNANLAALRSWHGCQVAAAEPERTANKGYTAAFNCTSAPTLSNFTLHWPSGGRMSRCTCRPAT